MQAIIIYDTGNDLSKEQVMETGKALAQSFGKEFTIITVPGSNFSSTKLADFAPLTADQALAALCVTLGGKVNQSKPELVALLFNVANDPNAHKRNLELLQTVCKMGPSHNARIQYGFSEDDRNIIATTLRYSGLL